MRLDLPLSHILCPPHQLSLSRARALSFSLTHTPSYLANLASFEQAKICSYTIANNIPNLHLDAAVSFSVCVRLLLFFFVGQKIVGIQVVRKLQELDLDAEMSFLLIFFLFLIFSFF